MGIYIRAILALTLVYVVHRFLSYDFLIELSPAISLPTWKIMLVGFLSDFWMSGLLTTILLLFFGLFKMIFRSLRAQYYFAGIVLLFAIFAAGHQSYVEFFKFQILPFHLRYLFDLQFLSANGASSVNANFLTIIGTGLLGSAFIIFGKNFERRVGFGSQVVITTMIVALALLVHIIHIRIKVQWMIPENLQANYVERLYHHVLHTPIPKELTNEELLKLSNHLDAPNPPYTKVTIADETLKLQGAVKNENQPVHIIVLLMESFRYFDIGAYQKVISKESITPVFDEYARSGILFSNAYSAGTVTRSGQEAVWCGYIGGIDTSLMRTFQTSDIECLPDVVQKKYGDRFQTMWLHGGDGKFDDQVSFWKRRGVKDTLDKEDFPDNAPRTGWGVGDRTFLKRAFEKILEQEDRKRATFSMILTVTNHIPWDLPSDHPDMIDFASLAKDHPSYATIRYADFAMGEFFQSLKSKSLWDRSLIVVVGDHGNLEPPRFDSLPKDPIMRASELSSRIGLLVTGGLIKEGRLISEPKSQADIAQFLGNLLDLDFKSFGYDLMATKRKFDPFVSLGDKYYFPKKQAVADIEKINQSTEFDSLVIRNLLEKMYAPQRSSLK